MKKFIKGFHKIIKSASKRQGLALLVGCILIIAFLEIGQAHAWFTHKDEVKKTIQTGNVTIKVNYNDEIKNEPLVPGCEYNSQANITNNGACPCYVRARILINDSELGKYIKLVCPNEEDWVFNEDDGYYYYKNVLKPNESTKKLLAGIILSEEYIEQENNSLSVNVFAEAVQSLGFESSSKAFETVM